MRKICFSNVLQDKGGQRIQKGQLTQLNLHQMVEQFTNCPSGDFTLRYSQHENYHSANLNLGFEEGYNPLDQWMSSQIQNNKENIADTQPRRKIPNQLLKYVQHTSKNPIQQNPNSKPFPKMMDMKQICKEYAENKKKGNNVQDNAPIWKFSSRQDSQNEMDRRDFESEIKQSLTAQKYKEQINLDQRENELLSNEFSKLKKQTIINAVKTLPEQAKGRNLSAFIEEIKNNLAQQIESMAQRIIQDRKKEDQEDQQLLTSQRKSISNNEKQRFEQARKQIGEYLNNRPCSAQREKVHYEKKTSPKAEGIVSFENDGKNEEAGVGYSFSSDFNSGAKGDQIHDEAPQQSHYTLKSNQANLPSSSISLANIDEIKSEKDAFEKRDDFIEDSMAVNYQQNLINVHQSIDKNFIKQIQSVAYTQNQNQYKANDYGKCLNNQINHQIHCNSSEVKPKESSQRNSFAQQININVKFVEDEQDVNISMAEDQPSFKQGSFKDGMNTPKVQNAEKIDFKKMTSPKRQNEDIAQASSPSNNIKSSNYFTSNTICTPVSTEAPTNTTITYLPQKTTSSICEINFSNILQQADQKQKAIYQTNNTSLVHNSVKMPLAENRNLGNQNSKERELQKVNQYHEALGQFNTNNIKQSINMTQEGKQGKLKLSTGFPNSNTVTEIRQIREQIHKDNNKQNTLIKISKYERTQVYVDQAKAKESIRSNVRGSTQFQFDLDF